MQVPPKSQSEEQLMAYTAMVKKVEKLIITTHCKRSLQALVASGVLLQGQIKSPLGTYISAGADQVTARYVHQCRDRSSHS